MARIDKVVPGLGNFRGELLLDWTDQTRWNQIRGVGLDANGRVVLGASVTGIVGFVIVDKTTRFAGTRIDIFTDCDVVDLGAGFAPGQKVYVDNVTGVPSAVAGGAAAPAGSTFVGFVMPDRRLVARLRKYA